MSKSNDLTKKKVIRVDKKEMKDPIEAINSLTSTLGKNFVCDRCGQEKRIILSALQGDLSDLKQINVCQDCLTLKELESFIGKDGINKMVESWSNKLQKLKLNPLSVAKYFYEKWKISDPVIMQRFIYFAYLGILEEENIILFEEKFQAWPGGPVLESVIYPMYENCEDLKNFFANINGLDNPFVLQYLEKIAKKYYPLESSQIQREAQKGLWREVRDNLADEGKVKSIDEGDIFSFIRQNKAKSIRSS